MSRKPDQQSGSRNEYIPSFITKKPFYVPDDDGTSATSDYLEHQRLQESKKQSDSKWYDRGRKAGPAATKYRKGACENCGAMSHKTKDCLDRPRKQGARWTGKDIQADEVVQEVSLGWDAKRDRWNGYDPSSYRQVVEDYEELERMKKRARTDDGGGENGGSRNGVDGGVGSNSNGNGAAGAATDGAIAAGTSTGKEEENEQEGKYAEESDMGRGQGNSTRQLRLREDTAKYLLNLDLESARYDPKTRSMVDNGDGTASSNYNNNNNDQVAALMADENFARASGDAAEFQQAQRYAWETQERGGPGMIHLQANPTSGEVEQRRSREAATQKRESTKKALLARYGGGEHLDRAPLADAAVTENERYVEYDEFGGVKGAPKKEARSKYAEDVMVNNHTSVWGSWWRDFVWGYACCHSSVKNSYCTGEEGKVAFAQAEEMQAGRFDADATAAEDAAERARDAAAAAAAEEKEEGRDRKENGKAENGRDDGGTRQKRSVRDIINGVSEEQMEEYRRSRATAQDPMADMLGKDELLDRR